VSAGGPDDQVSDLNVFWMATNADGSAPASRNREGQFTAYKDLRTYYVGLGGNRNTTTRFAVTSAIPTCDRCFPNTTFPGKTP